jgi:hypothetical protein
MIQRLIHLLQLIHVLRTRGNWPLIRRCRRQLIEFLCCRSGLNRRPLWRVIPYWYRLLKNPEMLVWRLETFGFVFLAEAGEEQKQKLNSRL